MIPDMSHDFSFDLKFATNLDDKSKLKDYGWGRRRVGGWTSHQMAMKPHGQNSTHAGPKGRNSFHGSSKVRVRLKKCRF